VDGRLRGGFKSVQSLEREGWSDRWRVKVSEVCLTEFCSDMLCTGVEEERESEESDGCVLLCLFSQITG